MLDLFIFFARLASCLLLTLVKPTSLISQSVFPHPLVLSLGHLSSPIVTPAIMTSILKVLDIP